jgi:hypothetical protein
MKRLHEFAQLLVASWKIGTKDNKIPTSHGILDRALKAALDQNALPEWAKDSLRFTDARVGIQCVELPEILDWAQTAELTSAPNPSYSQADIKVSENVALILLRRLGVDEVQARNLGAILRAASKDASEESRLAAG